MKLLHQHLLRKAIIHYYTAVVDNSASRTWYHNLYQQLEADGEVPNTATCIGKLGDEWIEPLFDRHCSDEKRHQQMWLDLLKRRNTYRPDDIPKWANTVAAFCDCGWLNACELLSKNLPIHQSELIVMFSSINALEALAVERFQLMADLHRKIDPEVAQLLDTIIKDEKFHLAYAREAVLRLGRRHRCEAFAQICLDRALLAYRRYAISLMPRYVDTLGKMGTRFSPWFLLLNRLLKIYQRLRPQLSPPPRMPAHLQSVIAQVEQQRAPSSSNVPA